jgi:hypothetical protein
MSWRHAVGNFDRTPLQLDHGEGDAVEVKDKVRPPLVTAAQGHFLGHLHGHTVAQQLVGAQVGLVKGDAGGLCGGHELFARRRKCGPRSSRV